MKFKFQHLEENNQNYSNHFKDAIYYSFESFKCSIYFFVHALWPDSLEKKGSSNITKLHEEIKQKYSNISKQNNENSENNDNDKKDKSKLKKIIFNI